MKRAGRRGRPVQATWPCSSPPGARSASTRPRSRRPSIPTYALLAEGFYERREVWDLLLALETVRDPRDDRALLGFLRSPFVGVRDETLLDIVRQTSAAGLEPDRAGEGRGAGAARLRHRPDGGSRRACATASRSTSCWRACSSARATRRTSSPSATPAGSRSPTCASSSASRASSATATSATSSAPRREARKREEPESRRAALRPARGRRHDHLGPQRQGARVADRLLGRPRPRAARRRQRADPDRPGDGGAQGPGRGGEAAGLDSRSWSRRRPRRRRRQKRLWYVAATRAHGPADPLGLQRRKPAKDCAAAAP